jgi:competence protein ComEA
MSDVVEIKPETPVPPIAEVETEKTSSDNPTPDVTGDAETVAPPEGTFLGMGRADQYVVGFFVIASFALMAVHWAQLSGWGLQPIEIERQHALPLDYRIDINTATWVEWIQLPGIGEVLARRIVEKRDVQGRRRSATRQRHRPENRRKTPPLDDGRSDRIGFRRRFLIGCGLFVARAVTREQQNEPNQRHRRQNGTTEPDARPVASHLGFSAVFLLRHVNHTGL